MDKGTCGKSYSYLVMNQGMELFCAWARSSAGHQAEEFIVQKPVQSPPPSLPCSLPPLPPPPLPQRMYDKQQVRKPNDVILVC